MERITMEQVEMEHVYDGSTIGAFDWLIKYASTFAHPSYLFPVINELFSIDEMRAKYGAHGCELEFYFNAEESDYMALVDKDSMLSDFTDRIEKAKEDEVECDAVYYRFSFKGCNEANILQVKPVIKKDEPLYKVVEFTVTKTSTAKVTLAMPVSKDEGSFEVEQKVEWIADDISEYNWEFDEYDLDSDILVEEITAEEVENEFSIENDDFRDWE